MHPHHEDRWPLDLVAMVVLLAIVNMATALWLDGWTSTALLLGATAAAMAGALRRGYTPTELGVAKRDVIAGLRVGVPVAALIVIGVTVAAALPIADGFFEDDRFADLSGIDVAYEAAVRIPFVTALSEELLFRSALLAVLLAATSTVRAVLLSSLAFGLWHVLTTIGDLEGNEVTGDFSGWEAAAGVSAVVVVTGVAGAFFAWLRLRTGSVTAPWLAHTAFNASAFVAGAVIASA